MLKFVLQLLGFIFAHTPELFLRAFSPLAGECLLWFSARRRRLVLSNLDHAFPDRSPAWRLRLARESSRRLVETALLSLAAPFLSEKRIRRIARLSSEVEALAREMKEHPRPVLLATLHLAYWESQTWFPLLSPVKLPAFGIIFRPLDNSTLDNWIKKTRERFGLKLLSRKEGFQGALRLLREAGCVGVLIDQNAGLQGALTTFFGRVCSTTELPGLLASKFNAEVRTFYPRRLGFWRVEFCSHPVGHEGTAESVTLALNRWLEQTLTADDNLCASWLWAHDRWRNQDIPAKRLRLEAKRNFLAADLTARNLPALPRRTRLWIRLPNWLGDVVMALPLLRAIRMSRPDAEITLLAKPGFIPLLEKWQVADRLEPLPPPGWRYFLHFRRLRSRYPDCYLLFTNSFRGDFEAWLTGCRQRFGILRHRKRRPLLSHTYAVPADFDERQHHQLALWENFLRHFGLNAPLDRTPPRLPIPARLHIGFIAGSENNPEKRWPVEHWRALIDLLPATASITLFGTAKDRAITDLIASGHADRVKNLAGRTDLPAYCQQLESCSLLIANDTGGMHLANALGVPLIGLFGPTNPLRTGPVFTGLTTLLQPPGCAPTGGGSLTDLAPATVAAELRRLLTL